MGTEDRLLSWFAIVLFALFCAIWTIDRAVLSTVETYQTVIEDVETEFRYFVNANSGGAPRPYSMVKVKIPGNTLAV